jgi:tRNA (guanine-N7-)-methyltransferase
MATGDASDHERAQDDAADGDQDQDLRSYGRRRGRKLSPRQRHLMTDLLARVTVPVDMLPDLVRLFASPVPVGGPGAGQGPKVHAPVADEQLKAHQVWLEIGFGGGEHLLWQAAHHPDVGLIGAEPFEEGVVKVLDAIDRGAAPNVRLLADDARALLRWLPPASISRVFILFPDPWPKRRHVKRRLVNAQLLALLARVMRPGAELRLATDIGDYARTMLMALQATDAFVWTARQPEDWRVRPADWPATRYEAKALREGRRCAFLRLVRTSASLA